MGCPSCGKIEVKAGNAQAKSLKTLASGVSDVLLAPGWGVDY